jgi:hypothetical protein
MRKRLIVAVLMVFLSFAPAYGGHSLSGGFWCECNNPESHVLNTSIEDDKEDTQRDVISNLEPLFLVLIALTLRYKV